MECDSLIDILQKLIIHHNNYITVISTAPTPANQDEIKKIKKERNEIIIEFKNKVDNLNLNINYF